MSLRDELKKLKTERRRLRARRNLERAWASSGSGRPATVPVKARYHG